MYCRADLSRTATLVVALFLAAISTNAVAREFCATNAPSEDHPTVQALRDMGRPIAIRFGQFMRETWTAFEAQSRRQAKTSGGTIVADFDRKPFEDDTAAIDEKVQRDPAAAALTERIRKVE